MEREEGQTQALVTTEMEEWKAAEMEKQERRFDAWKAAEKKAQLRERKNWKARERDTQMRQMESWKNAEREKQKREFEALQTLDTNQKRQLETAEMKERLLKRQEEELANKKQKFIKEKGQEIQMMNEYFASGWKRLEEDCLAKREKLRVLLEKELSEHKNRIRLESYELIVHLKRRNDELTAGRLKLKEEKKAFEVRRLQHKMELGTIVATSLKSEFAGIKNTMESYFQKPLNQGQESPNLILLLSIPICLLCFTLMVCFSST